MDHHSQFAATPWRRTASETQFGALAEKVVLEAKQHGFAALGVEGEDSTGWILVDLSDVVVHIMMPETRDFYALEKLWSVGDRDNASA